MHPAYFSDDVDRDDEAVARDEWLAGRVERDEEWEELLVAFYDSEIEARGPRTNPLGYGDGAVHGRVCEPTAPTIEQQPEPGRTTPGEEVDTAAEVPLPPPKAAAVSQVERSEAPEWSGAERAAWMDLAPCG